MVVRSAALYELKQCTIDARLCKLYTHAYTHVCDIPEAMVHVIYPRCYETKPSKSKGIIHTTASEGYMYLKPQLTAKLLCLAAFVEISSLIFERNLNESSNPPPPPPPTTSSYSSKIWRGRVEKRSKFGNPIPPFKS